MYLFMRVREYECVCVCIFFSSFVDIVAVPR